MYTWTIEVDRVTPEEWEQILDLFDDANIYQTFSYGKIRWGAKNLSHLVLKRNGEVVAAAQLRIVRPTKFKFGMAYLRWGPLCERSGTTLNREVLERMACALDEEYAGNRGLFLRILPNAFAGTPRAEMMQSAFGTFLSETASPENTYRTIVLDLDPSLEDLRKNLDVKWRNKLKQSEKNDLKVIAGHGMQEYQAFCDIYSEMFKRKRFETTVSVEEFKQIHEDLPEHHRMYTLIAEHGGTPVAGVVASAMGDSAIYLFGATSDAGLSSRGGYFLQWNLIQWLKANGIRWYDLCGIDPEKNPGVYQFKKGMSGADICQITPFVASKNTVSSLLARAGMALQNALYTSTSTWQFARVIKHIASRV